MDYRKYKRLFIILDNQNKEFGRNERSLKGHAKVEIKNGRGILRYYVQNLKYFDNGKYIYKCYLFGEKNKEPLYLNNGTIIIDKFGRGELLYRFNPADMDGQGSEFEDYNSVAVLAEPNLEITNDDNIHPVLVGYIDKSKEKTIDINRSMKKETKEELDVANKEDNNTEEVEKVNERKDFDVEERENKESYKINVMQVDDEKDVLEKNTSIQEDKEEAKEDKKELKEDVEDKEEDIKLEEKKEDVKQEKAEINKDAKEESIDNKTLKKVQNKEDSTKNNVRINYMRNNPYKYYCNYYVMVCSHTEKVLDYYDEVQPFERNIEDIRWWKIINSVRVPFMNNMNYHGNPSYLTPYGIKWYRESKQYSSCQDLIHKYQHYLFGIKRDNKGKAKHYIYGIPGRFLDGEQPDMGLTGFVYWHPLIGKERKNGDYGYWMLSINANTGEIEMMNEA